MATILTSVPLDETLGTQLVSVPNGAEVLRVHAEDGQTRLETLGDPGLKKGQALRVRFVRTGQRTPTERKEWFKGTFIGRDGQRYNAFVEPLDDGIGTLSTFGPLNWRGVWTNVSIYYTLDDVVRNSQGNLYRCHTPVEYDGAGAEPGVDAGWTDYWEVMISAGAGGGIPEAPIDGQQYVRQDASWVLNTAGGGGTLDQGQSFPDPYNEYYYTTYGVDNDWEAKRFRPNETETSTGPGQTGTKPTTLAALQGLTYS